MHRGQSPSSVLTSSPYGQFPETGDPFQFLPCTSRTVPPPLEDQDPRSTWRVRFDPNPEHWSWGKSPESRGNGSSSLCDDPYALRGIYLCGYLDVPLDYTNDSETRIARLAVTKYQVSGLKPASGHSAPGRGAKSERTIVVNPGGPGGSGTSFTWRAAEEVTATLSNNTFDVLGWDPRGVNTSQPTISCFPYDADRDRWSQLARQYREAASASPSAQLRFADAMNDAIFSACRTTIGDLARFVSTAFVARDMEEIRKALGEEELTAYLVSYGTGIGQTYANMFPDSVGRLVLDGTEYVRDHRLLGGFGWTALDNATDAWRDGFLGECIHAGPAHCALARPRGGDGMTTLEELEARMASLLESILFRPVTGYTKSSGPSIVTYSAIVQAIYGAMYNAKSWPALAQMLYELELGNSTLAAQFLEPQSWEYDPTLPCPALVRPSSDELGSLVICADSYDAPPPADGLAWWDSLWANMTARSWISGNSRFFNVLPCRHFNTYWDPPAEVYRGDLNHTLRHPVLLVAETHDPATPLRNGRRLAREMGPNARLVVHHGYGHSSRDKSDCTDGIARRYILHGELPEELEVDCYANEKPYLYGADQTGVAPYGVVAWDPVMSWRHHLYELRQWDPKL
ncbi:hypothetical protein VTK73DRAFT_7067 [Phialemonium thermophilum]|uniref:AB hydrolase-1 domain-containing protein n=1 Tax=Phialemonium thermophilum TaxID=223376 RepID=A0ABR3WHB1_9PEZI